MSPHRLQEDVIDRLETAKTRIIQSMMLIHEHADEYPANLADGMIALCEIELALGELRDELKTNKPDDGAPASPTEISQLATALSSKARRST